MDATRLTTSSESTHWIAVTVERNSDCSRHVGILYRDTSRTLLHLHFAWHRSLQQDTVSGERVCALPDFKFEEHEEWLSTFCSRIARSAAKRTVPYGLKNDGAVTFDAETGEAKIVGDAGLSCATFVVSVFRSGHHPIVDMTDWPPATPEDAAVQSKIVGRLERGGTTDERERGQAIKQDVGVPRVAPEHVAGACLEHWPDRPVRFAQCQENGATVIAKLDIHLSPPPAAPAHLT